MERKTWSRRRLLGALGAGLVGSVAGCSSIAPTSDTSSSDSATDTDPSADTAFDDYPGDDSPPRVSRAAQGSASYTNVYRQVRDSVVAVRVPQPFGQTARGTAWLYDDDHLVTNQHVVTDVDEVSVWFSGHGWRTARTVATDVYSDLAVLRVEERPGGVEPLPLVEQEPPIGTEVVAIGNPFGLSGSVSAGIISGQDRTLPAANGFSIPDAVQTDAAVNPGNSGGPLVTLDGQVVGVVNSGGGDNIGFAISAAMVRRVVPALIDDGDYEHSYMGVRLSSVTPRIVEANDLPISWGVYIDTIVDGGPSEGVLQGTTGEATINGDTVPTGGDVVFRMGETDIPTQQDLSSFLALETSPGDTIPVDVIRDGDRQTVSLTLGERPTPN